MSSRIYSHHCLHPPLTLAPPDRRPPPECPSRLRQRLYMHTPFSSFHHSNALSHCFHVTCVRETHPNHCLKEYSTGFNVYIPTVWLYHKLLNQSPLHRNFCYYEQCRNQHLAHNLCVCVSVCVCVCIYIYVYNFHFVHATKFLEVKLLGQGLVHFRLIDMVSLTP
jgi:hypothetical protein